MRSLSNYSFHFSLSLIGSGKITLSMIECQQKLGINDVFGQSGNSTELLESYGLTAENIVEKVKETIKHK